MSASSWVIFCIFSQFYFPISNKFFYLNLEPKIFDHWNWFIDGLKYSSSWLAHHAESYSAFLAISTFQFQRNFFNLNFWPKNFVLKKWFFDGLKYSFSWWADQAESYSPFLANSIFHIKRNFFYLNFWPKISFLKIYFLMGSNIVFRDQRITLNHILQL